MSDVVELICSLLLSWVNIRANTTMPFYQSQMYLLLTWLYALWQWIRPRRIVVCVFRLISGLFLQQFAGATSCIQHGNRVYKIVPGINDTRCWDDDVLPISPDSSDPGGNFVLGHRRHVVAEEQFLELRGGRQLLLTTHPMLCSIKRLEGYEFVSEHMPVMGKFTTAKKISDEDAIVLLANGHCAISCFGETLITSSYSEAEKNHLNFSMLATLPLFLQIKGYNLVAAYLSLAILVLDLLRAPISRAFVIVTNVVIIWVKLNVLQSWSQGYEILSLFSTSWLYSDQNAKCVYKSKGPFYCIYGSLLNNDEFTDCDDAYDLENMFKIEGDRGQWLPTPSESSLGKPFLFNDEILVA